MERRYQVFISSTFTDLMEERKEVIQALLELDCLPAGMEMFPSANDDQWTLIKKVIDQSDFYVVVVGGRYGRMSAQGISYTEMEYDHAVERGIPVLGFVHADPGSIAANKTEMDPVAQERLDKFRAKVQTKHVKMYNGAEDLGSKVSRALNIAMRSTDAEGWVRGRYAMTPEAETEVAQLRAQLAELKQQAQSVKTAEARMPENLASGDDVYEIQSAVEFYLPSGLQSQEAFYEPAEAMQKVLNVPVTWNEIMSELAPRLVDEASEQELSTALNSYAQRLLFTKNLLPPSIGEVLDVRLLSESFDDIVMQLFALNVTAHGTKPRGVGDHNKYWRLTEAGRDLTLKLRAIKKKSAVEVANR
jgi:hypothetical protein